MGGFIGGFKGLFQGGGFIPGFMAVSWVGLKDLVSWAVSRAVS